MVPRRREAVRFPRQQPSWMMAFASPVAFQAPAGVRPGARGEWVPDIAVRRVDAPTCSPPGRKAPFSEQIVAALSANAASAGIWKAV